MPTPACCSVSSCARRKSASRGRNFERGGKEELLRGGVLQRHALEHLLEEDAFVRRVLVDEDEALGTFGDEVELRDAADDVQPETVGDERCSGEARGDFCGRRDPRGGEAWVEGRGARVRVPTGVAV